MGRSRVRRGQERPVRLAPARLYNPVQDIEEEKSLAAENSETVIKRFQEAWRAWDKKNIAPLFPFKMKGGPWKCAE
jgi:hypothetical protein